MPAYNARYHASRGVNEYTFETANLDGALDAITDDLSRISSEGRPLPSRVEVYTAAPGSTAPLASGTLAPCKGCCSGWEVTWTTPAAEEPVATYRL